MSIPGEWISADIRVPSGTHLAPSRQTPGLNRALLFAQDRKGTVGPPEVRLPSASPDAVKVPGSFKLLDGIDAKTIAVASVALAVGVVTTIVIVKNGPKIKAWWTDKAFPRIISGLAWIADVDLDEYLDPGTKTALIGPVPTREFANEVGAVVADLREDMTSEEAQLRLFLVFMAAAIISDNLRKLGNARIREEDFEALQVAMSELTSGQVVDSLNEILNNEQLALDDETQAMFVKVFGGGRFVDGRYQPVHIDKVEDALRLTEHGEPSSGDDDTEDDTDGSLSPVLSDFFGTPPGT